MRFPVLGVALLLVPVLSTGGTPAQDPARPATGKPRLADLAWMAGHWRGVEEGATSEEIWAGPEGDDSMIGMWRLVPAGGRTRVLELLLLREDETGVSLRLRHFDRDLVAREEKDRPVVLRLARTGEREAVFEGEAVSPPGGRVRIEYRRPSADTLVGVVEHGGRREEFHFTRQGT